MIKLNKVLETKTDKIVQGGIGAFVVIGCVIQFGLLSNSDLTEADLRESSGFGFLPIDQGLTIQEMSNLSCSEAWSALKATPSDNAYTVAGMFIQTGDGEPYDDATANYEVASRDDCVSTHFDISTANHSNDADWMELWSDEILITAESACAGIESNGELEILTRNDNNLPIEFRTVTGSRVVLKLDQLSENMADLEFHYTQQQVNEWGVDAVSTSSGVICKES